MRVHLRVQPGARQTGPAGRLAGEPRLRLAAPPQDGRANEELIAFLAKALGLHRSDLRIVAGASARRKLLELPDSARAAFEALFPES